MFSPPTTDIGNTRLKLTLYYEVYSILTIWKKIVVKNSEKSLVD